MGTKETETTTYKLKRFESSSDKDFVKALRIYVDNIDNNSITNTNEISSCVDSYNQQFSDSDFTVVGLYLNKVLIGFCQFIYFKTDRLVFIDYLIIEKTYRKNNTFYEFLEKIKEYLELMNYHAYFVVGEINLPFNVNENEYASKTRNLIRLLKMNNFGIVNVPYYQPMLGIRNYESNLSALLMLYPVDENRQIKKDTFLMILKSIYFKHYERWYKLFLAENDARDYSIHLHELFGKISDKLKSTNAIQLNGYSDINYTKASINPTRVPKKILYFFIGFLVMILLIGGISFLLKVILHMAYKDQYYFYITTSIFYLFTLSIFSEKASRLLNKSIERFIDKIT